MGGLCVAMMGGVSRGRKEKRSVERYTCELW